MFRIIKAGAGIGLTENLNYIKKAENGCYILCPEHDASGIVFEGVAYHFLQAASSGSICCCSRLAGHRLGSIAHKEQ